MRYVPAFALPGALASAVGIITGIRILLNRSQQQTI